RAYPRAALGAQHHFEQGMRREAILKGVIGRVGDELCIIWPQGKKERVAVDEARIESQAGTGLGPRSTIVIFRGVEGVEGLRDVAGELSGDEARLLPIARAHGIGELRAVNADLPRKNASALELEPAELGYGSL